MTELSREICTLQHKLQRLGLCNHKPDSVQQRKSLLTVIVVTLKVIIEQPISTAGCMECGGDFGYASIEP